MIFWILTTSFRPLRSPLGGVVLHWARLAIYTPSARVVISCHHALLSISYRATHGFLKPSKVTNRCTATVCHFLPSYPANLAPEVVSRSSRGSTPELLASRPNILPLATGHASDLSQSYPPVLKPSRSSLRAKSSDPVGNTQTLSPLTRPPALQMVSVSRSTTENVLTTSSVTPPIVYGRQAVHD